MEIVEGLCESSSFECNRMVEEHEEQFETWWFKRWVLANADIVIVSHRHVIQIQHKANMTKHKLFLK